MRGAGGRRAPRAKARARAVARTVSARTVRAREADDGEREEMT